MYFIYSLSTACEMLTEAGKMVPHLRSLLVMWPAPFSAQEEWFLPNSKHSETQVAWSSPMLSSCLCLVTF